MFPCSILNPYPHISISIICNIIIDAIRNAIKICWRIVTVIPYYCVSITSKGDRQRAHILDSVYMHAYDSISPL